LAGRADRLRQVGARDLLLPVRTCLVNLEQEDAARVRERAGELLHEDPRPGGLVGLEDAPDLPLRVALAGRLQGRLDLRRVMPVVVDHHRALLFAELLEAA